MVGWKQGKEACFDDNNTFIETDCDFIVDFPESKTQCMSKGMAEGVFDATGATVPDLDSAVFTSTDDDREAGMANGE